jgi:hypothetical protein
MVDPLGSVDTFHNPIKALETCADDEGNRNPHAYMDLEVLLRSADRDNDQNDGMSVGETSSLYFSMLFLHERNRKITTSNPDGYKYWKDKAQESLSDLMKVEDFRCAYDNMDGYR